MKGERHDFRAAGKPKKILRRVSLTVTLQLSFFHFLFARTSLRLKRLARLVVFLCALLLWELSCWEWWTEIT